MLTDAQNKFISLTKEIEGLKETLKAKNLLAETLMTEIGLNTYFQDPSDGVVFKVCQPKGTFIEFKTVTYNRTKRGAEVKGDLSMKEAQEAGFILKGKE